MSAPRVYAAINAVAAAIARKGLPKDRFNLADDYAYRSIDELYSLLAPLLAEHRLCVLPRVAERTREERPGLGGEILTCVTVRTAFDLVSAEDGSCHTIEAFGEAFDASDKATAKAMTSAYKYALIEAFCIPVAASEDAEKGTPRLAGHAPAPPQGWDGWAADLATIIDACASGAAINRLQERNRALLHALSCERPELYASLGEAVVARRALLAGPGRKKQPKLPARSRAYRPTRKLAIAANDTGAVDHV